MVTRAGDLDVLVDPGGAPPYLELRARAVAVELHRICVPICSREDLIAMKLAAGRRVDHDDIAVLTHPAQRTAEPSRIHVERPTDMGRAAPRRPPRARTPPTTPVGPRRPRHLPLPHRVRRSLPQRRPARGGPVGTSRTARLATPSNVSPRRATGSHQQSFPKWAGIWPTRSTSSPTIAAPEVRHIASRRAPSPPRLRPSMRCR